MPSRVTDANPPMMQEVGQEYTSAIRPENNEGVFRGFVRRLSLAFERSPTVVPITSNVRREATLDGNSIKRTMVLKPIILPCHLVKSFVHVETVQLRSVFKIVMLIDAQKGCIATLTNASSKFIESKKFEAGLQQTVDFTLKLKKFPSKDISYMLSLQSDFSSIRECTNIKMIPNEGGSMSMQFGEQILFQDNKEYELLDIYGQPLSNQLKRNDRRQLDILGNRKSSVSITIVHSDSEEGVSDCVICLSEKRSTLLFPCRHMCICEECAHSFGQGDGKCPLCRVEYNAMMTIISDESILTKER